MVFQTEFEFTLPKGYSDEHGTLHRTGVMRLATAADEILPLKDPRVNANPAYIKIIILSRVITKLGNLATINPKIIENLYATDIAYLQSVYDNINGARTTTTKATCPKCKKRFTIDTKAQGT
jgi:hypothetical protein